MGCGTEWLNTRRIGVQRSPSPRSHDSRWMPSQPPARAVDGRLLRNKQLRRRRRTAFWKASRFPEETTIRSQIVPFLLGDAFQVSVPVPRRLDWLSTVRWPSELSSHIRSVCLGASSSRKCHPPKAVSEALTSTIKFSCSP
ncbi:hypothetical protein K402DRAFT_65568 [Aulographum hederae CBS 113979]|uniref:Uncharacterized protein n=1 Tax=Aulographum hederae CBS 113979 TaxID=1176131 RepID=A0A6G1H0P7_9PEZI|nr:hypothetical protein K402DRAFT_65568 [Aulographum hederae CBS 113979]